MCRIVSVRLLDQYLRFLRVDYKTVTLACLTNDVKITLKTISCEAEQSSIIRILKLKNIIGGSFRLCTESADIEEIAIKSIVNAESIIHEDAMSENKSDCYQEKVDHRCQNTILFNPGNDRKWIRFMTSNHNIGSQTIMKFSKNYKKV